VQVEARSLDEPVVDQPRLVRLQVVEHEVHLNIRRHALLDAVEEGTELDAAVTPLAGADHRAGLHVEGGEEVERAVAAVVASAPFGLARPQRECRRRALRGLDLRLLVHAQHQGALRRGQVMPDNVAHLLDECRIGGELEGLRPVRPQAEGAPDAAHRGLAHAGAARHRARAPVRGVPRCLPQRQGDQALDRLVADGPRRPGARRVHQPLQAALGEAPAPGRHRLAAHAQSGGHPGVGRARLRAGQHDLDALGQGLAHAAPAQQATQFGPLRLGQFQRYSLGSAGHGAPPTPGAASYSRSPKPHANFQLRPLGRVDKPGP
jgi:hypothetical protein